MGVINSQAAIGSRLQGSTGPIGPPGPRGATWFTGEGPPPLDLGENNDLYLDTLTGDVYKKELGTWL